MKQIRWAHFTIPHTSVIEGETLHSSLTLKQSVASIDSNIDIQDCFIKAIGAYLAQQGVTPNEVKNMTQEAIYDQLLGPEASNVIEKFLLAQGVSISRWDIINTDGHSLSVDRSFLEARERSCEVQQNNSRPSIRIID